MARTRKEVTDAELTVLEALWALGPSAARDVAERVYGETTASACASVLTLCERLRAKGFVRQQPGRPRRFAASVAREDLIGSHLERLAQRLCGGAYLPLLSHLVRDDKLEEAEITALRELVDRLEREARARRDGRGGA